MSICEYQRSSETDDALPPTPLLHASASAGPPLIIAGLRKMPDLGIQLLNVLIGFAFRQLVTFIDISALERQHNAAAS